MVRTELVVSNTFLKEIALILSVDTALVDVGFIAIMTP